MNEQAKKLTDEYTLWLKENNLPELSADELVMETKNGELDGELITTPEQRQWLNDFINRWESVEG